MAGQQPNGELTQHLQSMLDSGDPSALERYLMEHSNLPGPRMNLALVNAFADVVGDLITQADRPLEYLEELADGWAALSLEAAPVNNPREFLPCAAVLTYGQAAVSRPDWWEDEIAKLHQAASDPRWRVREMVAMALQRMLAVYWDRTFMLLRQWVAEDDPLALRAAAAAIAEPPIISRPGRGYYALEIQESALQKLAGFPADTRRTDAFRALRKALGFTVSVAVAAAPDAGFRLLEQLASSVDQDVRWVVRENLKKNRLKPWAEQVEVIQARLSK